MDLKKLLENTDINPDSAYSYYKPLYDLTYECDPQTNLLF